MSVTARHAFPESSVVVAEALHKPQKHLSAASVLVTDEHYKHSLGIVRHLGRMGVHVSVVASAKDSLVSRSRYCRETVLSRGTTVEAFVQATLQAVQHRHYDLVIPVSFPMTLALAGHRDLLCRHSHIELLDSSAIEHAADKGRMTKLATKVGVPVPKTYVPSCPEEINSSMAELLFPLVVKPQRESPGRSPVRYVRDRRALQALLEEKPFSGEEAPLLQEFIPGFGCGFFATYQDGVCKRIFMHRRIREYPASGGVSCCAESFYDSKLESYGRRMLDALGWHGVAMVEFRYDSRDGEYKLLEINPKFWGSLDLALAAGADFPGDLCQMALGKTLAFVDSYQRRLRFQWPLSGSGELFHLWTHPASILNVAFDFLDPRVRSNIWISDPAPNFQELQDLLKQFLRRRKG